MDFLEFHYKGTPFPVRADSIEGLVPALDQKGRPNGKYILVTHDEGTSGLEVDETYQDIITALTTLDLEILPVANDEGEE